MSANNSKPKPAPVVTLREEPSDFGRYMLLFLPAIFGSIFFHAVLVTIFVLYVYFQPAPEPVLTETGTTQETIASDPAPKTEEATFTVVDIDPARVEFDTDINFNNDNIQKFSIPGEVVADEKIGIVGGDPKNEMQSLPAPGGYGGGQGGAMEVLGPGNVDDSKGTQGGYFGPRGLPLDRTFEGRSGSTKEKSLREGGGTTESEVAVTNGLRWLVRQQLSDGRWTCTDNTAQSNIAGTAFGLLPFLAAGKTHKPADKNPYDKNIEKGLNYLKKSQDPKTGFFGGTMYSHGLATIAMCEAYGLSQDPALRRYAQGGINLIVSAQGDATGSWDYGPAKSARPDMSVSGWQIMALKSGQMAGLNVPTITITRVKSYLRDSCDDANEGYGYSGKGSTPRMTAVGLLCRQYMENWGPSNERMIKAIKNHITPTRPIVQDVYYYYYATQVMHHQGGESWKKWNEEMRDTLVKKQDKTTGANGGSWSPAGDPWAGSGGRLMITSLNLLTLEVYYRYLPLYYRDAGYSKDRVVQGSL